jgi:hypothetical protein
LLPFLLGVVPGIENMLAKESIGPKDLWFILEEKGVMRKIIVSIMF